MFHVSFERSITGYLAKKQRLPIYLFTVWKEIIRNLLKVQEICPLNVLIGYFYWNMKANYYFKTRDMYHSYNSTSMCSSDTCVHSLALNSFLNYYIRSLFCHFLSLNQELKYAFSGLWQNNFLGGDVV